ncbi:hypothetical protein V5799_003747 [Amblyomma americanum]|uniref:SAP domain-containing protein n=1 Tax=Amblyomma americanum TaxID=6943 RepID=A0AAQ4D832_AMBAM
MAQSTGSQSNAISEYATTARRTSSTDSTIVYSPLYSVDRNLLGTVKKKQLEDELKCRELLYSGGKDELISRILEDNIRQRASDEMDPPTISQAANEDDRQAYLEALSTIKEICSEVKIVRVQLAQANTSTAPGVCGNVGPVVPTPKENVTSSGRSPTSATADGTIAGTTDGSPTASDSRAHYYSGLNGSAHIPPPCAASDETPSMAAILGMIATTQAQLATALMRNPAATAPVQIHSTSDTSSANTAL